MFNLIFSFLIHFYLQLVTNNSFLFCPPQQGLSGCIVRNRQKRTQIMLEKVFIFKIFLFKIKMFVIK